MNQPSRDHSGNARSAATNPRRYGYYLPVHCEDELDSDVARWLTEAYAVGEQNIYCRASVSAPNAFGVHRNALQITGATTFPVRHGDTASLCLPFAWTPS